MRLNIQKYSGSSFLFWITGNRKFKLFMVSKSLLRYDCSSYHIQEYILFNQYDVPSIDWYSSGERKLTLLINSKEEQEELSELFRNSGFKVRYKTIQPDIQKESVWFSPNSNKWLLPIDEEERDLLFGYKLVIFLRRKDLKKFLDLIKTLSDSYNYKTIWFDRKLSKGNRLIL